MDQKEITIYSTPTCHFCQMTKEYFGARNIPYTDFNVAADAEKRQEMIDRSGQMGVPVVFIGDEMIIGFDKRRFDELLPETGAEATPAAEPVA
jgi:glutaredoxin-like YruB-family protein